MDEEQNIPADQDDTQPRQATPQQQKAFEAMAKQALQMLLQPQSGEMILAGAKAKGPEQAVADAVAQVMQASIQAAEAAGVEITDDVANAAAKPGVLALVQILHKSGFIKDPGASAVQVLQMVDQAIQIGGSDGDADADDAAGGEPPVGAPSAADEEEF